ncbi:MAG: DUF4105 domain-containing protein, partial [Nitrospirae bacterium]|nr:DUF4105 domain-containing protein [Nitrospirota bacterium]
FFLSPTGKTDPQAEMDATLAQFFSDEPVGRSRQPAQCAFVARYHWLKDKLAFDDRRLPLQPCDRFDAWFKELNAQSVTMIFPSAFMNNPASMFGHTLLRIDQQGQTEQTRILAYTINFAADVPPDPGIRYVVKGMMGGYKGNFSTTPYYLKVQEYRDIENRDIWEYRLNLTEGQIRRLLMHAWELGNTYFDYYFFRENCAYQVLTLLEVADPNWHLTDRFLFWTVPADTVRALTEQPGLVGEVVYRPARSTQIKRKRERLSGDERGWFGRIMQDPSLAKSQDFTSLSPDRQTFVLDLASDYLRYKSVTDEGKAELYKERNRAVLIDRSRLKVQSEDLHILPFTAPPDQGHKTSRAGLGLGWRGGEFFQDLTVRAGVHDLLDPDKGYNPDAQIELGAVSLRHYQQRNQTRLERATLVNIISLSPLDPLFLSPSWKVSAGMETVNCPGCSYCSSGNLNGGLGGAVESHLWRREVLFAFAEADANVSGAYREQHRVGGGGTLGALATLSERWKVMVSTTYLRYPLGDRSDDFRIFFGQRYTVQDNLALRFEFNRRYDDTQAVFYVQGFF